MVCTQISIHVCEHVHMAMYKVCTICSYCKQFENNSINKAATYGGLTIVETFSASRIVERRAVKDFKGVKLCLNHGRFTKKEKGVSSA